MFAKYLVSDFRTANIYLHSGCIKKHTIIYFRLWGQLFKRTGIKSSYS